MEVVESDRANGARLMSLLVENASQDGLLRLLKLCHSVGVGEDVDRSMDCRGTWFLETWFLTASKLNLVSPVAVLGFAGKFLRKFLLFASLCWKYFKYLLSIGKCKLIIKVFYCSTAYLLINKKTNVNQTELRTNA